MTIPNSPRPSATRWKHQRNRVAAPAYYPRPGSPTSPSPGTRLGWEPMFRFPRSRAPSLTSREAVHALTTPRPPWRPEPPSSAPSWRWGRDRRDLRRLLGAAAMVSVVVNNELKLNFMDPARRRPHAPDARVPSSRRSRGPGPRRRRGKEPHAPSPARAARVTSRCHADTPSSSLPSGSCAPRQGSASSWCWSPERPRGPPLHPSITNTGRSQPPSSSMWRGEQGAALIASHRLCPVGRSATLMLIALGWSSERSGGRLTTSLGP
jgi:hypothetical protein